MNILQIIPAPKGMQAVYKPKKENVYLPILVLALVEANGRRWVQPLSYDMDTGVSLITPEESDYFEGYEYGVHQIGSNKPTEN
ncbi:MAG TPA: hypothetical protein IAA58_07175 [Candidatus Gallacutalibacter stercoravium]|nr:hypothetical protein [Candidatus Gallacutalibacter stercoravium]